MVDALVGELIARGKLFPKEEAMCQTSVSRPMLNAYCLTCALCALMLISKVVACDRCSAPGLNRFSR